MTLWTEADSRALDRRIRGLRRRPFTPPKPSASLQGQTTTTYGGVPRGYLSDEERQRRKKVERAMQVRAEREAHADERSSTYKANRAHRRRRVRQPTPKQKSNGRWLARCVDAGQLHTKTFDTREEAQAFLDEITKEK